MWELTAIDRHFAGFICRQAGKETSPWLASAAALLSNAVGNGHVCLRLAGLAGTRVRVDGEERAFPGLDDLAGSLVATPVVGAPGSFRPLILCPDGRLYLYRYWTYERDLGRILLEMSSTRCEVDERLLREGLVRMFPAGAEAGPDWQQVASAVAVRKRFCVISGGPGTGKTSTVVKIIALLAEQSQGRPFRVALAAPTGKSAARLKESICSMKEGLDCNDGLRELIPGTVSTIHRLLGAWGSSVRFRYSESNQLPWDTVIVDEASMVALPLMAKLARALRPDARLILLGDRDQLASVEAGAVLGDICGRGRHERFSTEFDDFMHRVAGVRLPESLVGGTAVPLTDSFVMLRKNYRFGAGSGIGTVAAHINDGEGTAALSQLRGGATPQLSWRDLPSREELKKSLTETVIAGYETYLHAVTPVEALKMFDVFRVLCALRQGPYGVSGINTLIEEILADARLIAPRSRWYRGRPVMVTANDYHLKLFNGDVGIVFPDAEADGALRVFFNESGGGVREIAPVRLPPHETVFAMTVHKSQGSEFDSVLLMLPDRDSEVLSRELIYTGVTRARTRVELWGDETVFLDSVRRRTERDSGLEEALWSSGDEGDLTHGGLLGYYPGGSGT